MLIAGGKRDAAADAACQAAVLFWGWLWGFPGMLLAVPILASIKISMGAVESLPPHTAIIDSEGDAALRAEEAAVMTETRSR